MRITGMLSLTAGLVLTLAASVSAQCSKPLAILSLSSYDSAKFDVHDVEMVKNVPQMPTWLSSMFALYAEGREAKGLDHSRPWGAVVQLGSNLSAYAFVPVTNAELLAQELKDHISSQKDVGNGVYEVQGKEAGIQLYAKEAKGWIFVSDSQETLTTVPENPTLQLDGMDKKYDVALRIQAKNVSEGEKTAALGALDKMVGPMIRQFTTEQGIQILGQVLTSLDEITFGWSTK